ncbi:DUF1659 domain-containing protein [Clostridium weizhouense]|uniref:DUF1659 domain-containing protein n=1 Tax=Clostridium weizhouense TaxID=2859781 RepID=A0ABS7AJD9_9CLOT|nr:DUF1659 domain-containing protein [Clostridium weizhouense]MBW6408789.1 DUF1659 domain-containing protein [Clostridium weizhouense]
MAINKFVKDTIMSIEIQKGVDKSGDPVFTKKNFSSVKEDASEENVYDVAQAIKDIMDGETRSTFITVSSKLMKA